MKPCISVQGFLKKSICLTNLSNKMGTKHCMKPKTLEISNEFQVVNTLKKEGEAQTEVYEKEV